MRRVGPFLAVLTVALLLFVFFRGLAGEGRPAALGAAPVADLTLALLDGGTLDLAELRGRVVVVNFWAAWCPSCREEPEVLTWGWRYYRSRNVAFVAVCVQSDPEEARKFAVQPGEGYYAGLDETGRWAQVFGITGVPETYVLDRTGRIAGRWVGPLTAAALRNLVEAAGN